MCSPERPIGVLKKGTHFLGKQATFSDKQLCQPSDPMVCPYDPKTTNYVIIGGGGGGEFLLHGFQQNPN